MFAFIALLIIFCLVQVLYRFKYRRRLSAFATFPTMQKHFILHNSLAMADLRIKNLLQKIEKWQNELGEVFLFTLHPFDCGAVFVNDPVIAEAVSLHQADRSRSFLYKSSSDWIGADGFFLSPLESSKKQLKPLWIAFNPKNHDKYSCVINRHINLWLETMNMKEEIFLDPSIFQTTRRMALDIAFDSLFDYKLDTVRGKNLDYVTAIKKFSKLAMVATFDLKQGIKWLYPHTRLSRELKKHLKVMTDFTLKIVKERRKMFDEGLIKNDDFILDYYFFHKVEGEFFSDDKIRAEIDTMILGSHDTSQNAFGFMIYNLAKHPDIQQKVFEEISPIMRDDPDRDITEEDIGQLQYVDCIIKETLRIYPPVPFIGRKLTSEITTGGFTFPEDVEIIISPYLIGRNPKYFKDPLVFDPDRFLGVETLPLEYTPFSIGAKKCIGGKLAFIGMKLILIKVISKFELSLPEDLSEIKLTCELVLATQEDVPILLKRRK